MVLNIRTIITLLFVSVMLLPGDLQAEPVFAPWHPKPYDTTLGSPATTKVEVVKTLHLVDVPDAPWLQIHFGEYNLGSRSYVTLTALEDGAQQRLDSSTLPEWHNASALFNGGQVEIEVHVAPGEKDIFISVDGLVVGERLAVDVGTVTGETDLEGDPGIESLCGSDNRVASTDSRVGRISGCTAWLISNGAVLTAGHCADYDPDRDGPLLPDGILDLSGVMEFNIPLSDADGTLNRSDPDDQYPIDTSDVTWNFDGSGQGLGKDWTVFALNPNSNTGLRAHEVQGFFRLTRQSPTAGSTIRVTGCGVDDTPSGTTGGDNAQNRTLQTSTGPYRGEATGDASVDIYHYYTVDTTGAGSGSPIIWESNGFTLGIHTNGGCEPDGSSYNHGTSFEVDVLEQAVQDFPGSSTVYVDSIASHPSPLENGTVLSPYDTVAEAVTTVVSGGRLSIVEGNYYAASGNTFLAGEDGKSFLIEAPVGTVTIGN